MTPYLYEHENPNAPRRENGLRFWGYPSRTEVARVIAVHTAESFLDLIGADTGAEGVARFQSQTARASSYHRIVDSDSTVICLPDDAVAFGVGSFNSPTLHVSLALRATDWNLANKEVVRRRELALTRAAHVVADWSLRHGIPIRRISRNQALGGSWGLVAHGDMDPTRRTDPGPSFPWARFMAMATALTVPTTLPGRKEYDVPPTVLRGSTGKTVRKLQGLLLANGHQLSGGNCGVDGDFGASTEERLRIHQTAHLLPPTGICDDATWLSLIEK